MSANCCSSSVPCLRPCVRRFLCSVHRQRLYCDRHYRRRTNIFCVIYKPPERPARSAQATHGNAHNSNDHDSSDGNAGSSLVKFANCVTRLGWGILQSSFYSQRASSPNREWCAHEHRSTTFIPHHILHIDSKDAISS